MFTLMNSDSLWIGKDLQKFNRLRDCLDQAGIPYSHKTRNRMGQWNGQGTVRGRNFFCNILRADDKIIGSFFTEILRKQDFDFNFSSL